MYAQVIPPLALHSLIYAVPDTMKDNVRRGVRVVVPIKNKHYVGVVENLEDDESKYAHIKNIKPITSVLDSQPTVLDYQLHLWRWIAEYYMCPPGDVMAAALPSLLKKIPVNKKPYISKNDGGATLSQENSTTSLTPAQQTAYEQILSFFQQKETCLLHGVTSSGKTEIYVRLIKEQMEKGKQVLYLLPEIAITTQIKTRLHNIFGSRMAVYHSACSDKEREELWRRQCSDTPCPLVLGARSSVFLPFTDLGLIIVDEEHETSYKQEEPAPRYHARSVAMIMARRLGAKTLLGTATPCLETFYNAKQGKYGYVRLSQRYRGMEMPEIRVIDTKDLSRRKLMKGSLSPILIEKIGQSLYNHRQVILFRNRRGYSNVIECGNCGWIARCQQCDVPLTLHKHKNILECHYCGYRYKIPNRCPNCGNANLLQRGEGTEKIEEHLRRLFPAARVVRLDLDSTRRKMAYDTIIDDFSAGRSDILVGTQMVIKGLDFDNVNLVGIINADQMLNQPDFRAWEHAFSMITQVAGRSGRKDRRGLVLLQTRDKDLPLIDKIVRGDFDAFYHDTLLERKQFRYPPFSRLITVYLRHNNERTADSAAIELGGRLRETLGDSVLGPDAPPVARVRRWFIRKLLIKLDTSLSPTYVRQCLRKTQKLLMNDKNYASLDIYYDVDPL